MPPNAKIIKAAPMTLDEIKDMEAIMKAKPGEMVAIKDINKSRDRLAMLLFIETKASQFPAAQWPELKHNAYKCADFFLNTNEEGK